LPPTPTPQMTHIIRTGDSAWAIALQYGLTLEQLLAYNNLTEAAILLPGNELWIRPTFTPIATPTSEATATAAPTHTQTPSPLATSHSPLATPLAPRSSLLAPLPTPTAVPPANNLSQTLYRGSMVASVGFLVLAGIILLAMRKNNGLADD